MVHIQFRSGHCSKADQGTVARWRWSRHGHWPCSTGGAWDGTAHAALADRIRLILDGRIATPELACRRSAESFAAQLGVSRTTVTAARTPNCATPGISSLRGSGSVDPLAASRADHDRAAARHHRLQQGRPAPRPRCSGRAMGGQQLPRHLGDPVSVSIRSGRRGSSNVLAQRFTDRGLPANPDPSW